jgi:hypothetical protein
VRPCGGAVVRLCGCAGIFEEDTPEKSKPVAQLAGWCTIACLYAGDGGKAETWNKKAEALVTKAFGASSWEMQRVMLDKARCALSCHCPLAKDRCHPELVLGLC